MAWPLSQDYNEAIQNPLQSFSDPELRAGQPVVNALGLPMPRSGNFADVYEFDCPSTGNKWAIKCFTREVPGLRERYAEISKYLAQKRLPFMVEFQYLEQGMRICGQWYPILKMRWVEGFLLNQFVAGAVDKPATLDALLQVWLRMAHRLREVGIAHGDLQHGNVLLVPGSNSNSLAVKLIDYDGMFVPALARKKSGEVGHPSYQHPQRLREGVYSAEVDRFPLLVICCAIRGLMVGGRSLWERHDNGDNLLFREEDLRAPRDSALVKELVKLTDPELRMLVDRLSRSVYKSLEETPLLEELVPVKEPAPAVAKKPASSPTRPALVRAAVDTPFADLTPARRRKRRPPILGWAVAAAAAVLVGIVLTGMWVSAGNNADPTGKEQLAAQGKPGGVGVDSPARPKERGGHKPDRPKEGGSTPGPEPRIEVKPPPPGPKPEPKPERPPEPRPVPEKKPESDPKPGQVMENSLGMKLAYIPPGKFLMGTSDEEIERTKKETNKGYLFENWDTNEAPRHEVRITRGFYMGIYEMTQGPYEKLMGTNPSFNKESPDHPVEQVYWRDAVACCEKLSALPEEKQAGRVYRLPTEAEWEYACRAGTTTAFHYGNTLSWKQANFDGSQPFGNVVKGPPSKKTVKVGSYQPNAWGLYDMHGNVWEWCLDGPRKYTPNAVDDPRGLEIGDARVLRGGGWREGAVRSAYRKAREAAGPKGYRGNYCGFRVVCEVAREVGEP
jgi:formylglycine-generating enzyme required for sulfatase activity